ncbi:uncharacterized protein [Medicago truncatula]|uniref:uncharacterized protein isoform X2 n=1 Tax=Medicago truncatula TaxID=3880 RepID=UPI001967C860|nr:uncharacterized protein LOC112420155 isoform X2 [Medicago truncatula]
MANIIMYLYPIFRSMEDKYGVSPLEILATRTSAFESSKNQLSWWMKILYNCISVKVSDPKTRIKLYGVEDIAHQEKGDQRIPSYNVDDLEKACKVRHTLARLDFTAKILCHCIQMFVFAIWHTLFSSPRKRWSTQSLLGAIKRVKMEHICGSHLLEAFMKDPYESYMCGGADPFDYGEHDEEIKEKAESFFEDVRRKREEEDLKKNSKQEREGNQNMEDLAKNGVVEIMEELNSKVKASDKKGLLLVAMKELEAKKSGTNDTAYLRAAKHGITEIMLALESKLKSVIHETNSDNENALLIAVKYRQPQVVEGLWKRLSMETFQSINQQVDINENTILHLAAFTATHNENNAWRISSAAMQMMWDIKWYKDLESINY